MENLNFFYLGSGPAKWKDDCEKIVIEHVEKSPMIRHMLSALRVILLILAYYIFCLSCHQSKFEDFVRLTPKKLKKLQTTTIPYVFLKRQYIKKWDRALIGRPESKISNSFFER